MKTTPLWFAYMDTTHFQFHAIGGTDEHAREQLAAGFARHLQARARDGENPYEYWNAAGAEPEAPDVDTLHEYYGIRTIDASTAQAWCDGEPL